MNMAIILQKPLHQAKNRLKNSLSPKKRMLLAESMLYDTLQTIRAAAFDRVAIVTGDPDVAEIAEYLSVEVIHEYQVNGMNEALKLVIQNLPLSIHTLFIFPADIPFIQVEEMNRLIQITRNVPVTIIPCKENRGTNGLVLSPPDIMETGFGTNSMSKHCRVAEDLGIPYLIYQSGGIAFDIDTDKDLQSIQEWHADNKTKHFLSSCNIHQKIKGVR